MPGSPQNRVRFPEKSHWCASRYLGCLEAVRPGFALVPGRDAEAGPALRLAVFPQGPLFPQLPRSGFGECSQEGLGLHGRGGSDL